ADDVEDPSEAVFLALRVAVQVSVAATGREVVLLDVHLVAVRPQPLPDELGIAVGREDRLDGCVELALEVDERDTLGDGDVQFVAHDYSSCVERGAVCISDVVASSASSLRNCCSWMSR